MQMDDTEQLIADCEARETKLSEWEAGFVQSIREQFNRKGSLSEKQLETLEKIWEKVT